MRAILALWRREVRAHVLPLVGLVAIGAAIDVLQLRQSAAIGDVSPFDRIIDTLLPFVVVVAAVLASRAFHGEAGRGTWPWLFSLPVPPTTVMLAKLSWVMGGTTTLIWCRLGTHALLGAPTPWWELVVRVFTRATAVSLMLGAVFSAGALLGRRAVLLGLVVLLTLTNLGQLLDVSITEDGPLGLVNGAHVGVDDRTWPLGPILVTALISLVAAVAVVTAGRLGVVGDWLARPWSQRAVLALAAALGALVALELAPLQRAITPIPAGLTAARGQPILLSVSSPAPATPPNPDEDAAIEAGRAAAERALALMGRAVPELLLPRVVMVRRDDIAEPHADFLDDDTVVLAAGPSATPAAIASVLVGAMLARERSPADVAGLGFLLAGLPTAIGQRVAPSPMMQEIVLRRATCVDAQRWPTVRDRFGANAAAAAFLVDIAAAHGDVALEQIVAALWRGGDDVAAIIQAGGPVCDTPPPTTGVPWLGLGQVVGATFALRPTSTLTASPFVQVQRSSLLGAKRAFASVWRGGFLNVGERTLLVDEEVPVDTLEGGTLLGVAVAPGTPLWVSLTIEREGPDGQVQRTGTGVLPLGGR